MPLVDEVTERESCLFLLSRELKKTGQPLVLYGIGEAAGKIYPELLRQGIDVRHVAVDRKYLANPPPQFYGHVVEAFEEVLAQYEKVNVVVGINDARLQIEKRLSAFPQVARVIKYDYCTLYSRYAFTVDYIRDNAESFEETYEWLSDELSRRTMAAYLNQRISGDFKHLRQVKAEHQYFPDDIMTLRDGEIFVDCGAFDGDSIIALTAALERAHKAPPKKIIALEPDEKNFAQLVDVAKQYPQATCLQKGAWDRADTLAFSADGRLDSAISSSGEFRIEVDSIDHILNSDEATFLKMDIEGAELAALKGATATIKKHKPKLAICIYHRQEDLITIPQFIRNVRTDYVFYLRAHSYDSEEVVLYAL